MKGSSGIHFALAHAGYYDDEVEAAKAYDVKARELRGEMASGANEKKSKHAGAALTRLNFPTEEEKTVYEAAVARLAKNKKCNAGNPDVWGDNAGDGFDCGATAKYKFESEDDANVHEGQVGYLCNGHDKNYKRGSLPLKPAHQEAGTTGAGARGVMCESEWILLEF